MRPKQHSQSAEEEDQEEEEEEERHRLVSVVRYDLCPARSHHQVLIVVLDGDRIAGGLFQQLHLCECLHCSKRYKRIFFFFKMNRI